MQLKSKISAAVLSAVMAASCIWPAQAIAGQVSALSDGAGAGVSPGLSLTQSVSCVWDSGSQEYSVTVGYEEDGSGDPVTYGRLTAGIPDGFTPEGMKCGDWTLYADGEFAEAETMHVDVGIGGDTVGEDVNLTENGPEDAIYFSDFFDDAPESLTVYFDSPVACLGDIPETEGEDRDSDVEDPAPFVLFGTAEPSGEYVEFAVSLENEEGGEWTEAASASAVAEQDYFGIGDFLIETSEDSVEYGDSFDVIISGMEAWGGNSDAFTDVSAEISLGDGLLITGVEMPTVTGAKLRILDDSDIEVGSGYSNRTTDTLSISLYDISGTSFYACGECAEGSGGHLRYKYATGNKDRADSQHGDEMTSATMTFAGFAQRSDLVLHVRNVNSSQNSISKAMSGNFSVEYTSGGKVRSGAITGKSSLSSGTRVKLMAQEEADDTEGSGNGADSSPDSESPDGGSGSGSSGSGSSGDSGSSGSQESSGSTSGSSGDADAASDGDVIVGAVDVSSDDAAGKAETSSSGSGSNAGSNKTSSVNSVDLSKLNLTAIKATATGGSPLKVALTDGVSRVSSGSGQTSNVISGGDGAEEGLTEDDDADASTETDGTAMTLNFETEPAEADSDADESAEDDGIEEVSTSYGFGLFSSTDSAESAEDINADAAEADDGLITDAEGNAPVYKRPVFWAAVAAAAAVLIILLLSRRNRGGRAERGSGMSGSGHDGYAAKDDRNVIDTEYTIADDDGQ